MPLTPLNNKEKIFAENLDLFYSLTKYLINHHHVGVSH